MLISFDVELLSTKLQEDKKENISLTLKMVFLKFSVTGQPQEPTRLA
jgi:hypothetical protein